METVNHYLFTALRRYADQPMQVHRDRTWTYGDAARAAHGVALRLAEMGLQPGERVALISENSPRWLHAYLGILAAGGVVVPRGEDIAQAELDYIIGHSESRIGFSEKRELPAAVNTIPLAGDGFPEPADLTEETLDGYASARQPEDLATLLYTSGTTGRPKGVMLEHRNIAHNIRVLPSMVGMSLSDRWVSVLPSWHTFELTVELCGFSVGCVTVYSDKRRLKDDLAAHRPQFFASVPRIWQTIHDGAHAAIKKKGGVAHALFRLAHKSTRMWRKRNPLGLPFHLLGKKLFYGKIAAATGGRLKCAVSGGGYLPAHVDEFFEDMGVTLLIGYGLTETAPVVALRDLHDNVLGTIGRAVPETEIRVGEKGTFEIRGPQVMRGYYKEEALTQTVLDRDGWFDTGDLGRMTPKGDLIFVGRLKETIVLSGGENVEPEPIENAILESPMIQQVMLVGQDRKALGALVVASPEVDADEAALAEEVRRRTASFRSFEQVHRIGVLEEPFSPENGLMTATLKLRRNVIAERLGDRIDAVFEH